MIMNLDSAMENGDKSTKQKHQIFFTAIGRRHGEVDSMVIERGRWSRYSTLSQIAVLTGDELVVSFRFILTA